MSSARRSIQDGFKRNEFVNREQIFFLRLRAFTGRKAGRDKYGVGRNQSCLRSRGNYLVKLTDLPPIRVEDVVVMRRKGLGDI